MSSSRKKYIKKGVTVVMVSSMSPEQVKRNRWKLMGIFAVAGLPVIFAMVMYFGQIGLPGGSTVKGNLVNPAVAYELLGDNTVQSAEDKKWRLFVTGEGPCEQTCRDLLHTIRQVHISMGREMSRVERAVVCTSCEPLVDDAALGTEGLKNIRISQADLDAFSDRAKANGAQYSDAENWVVWIVDPLGNVMLQYQSDHDGYDMIADLKKLLKLSNIG